MKKKQLFILLIILLITTTIGCSKLNTPQKEVEPKSVMETEIQEDRKVTNKLDFNALYPNEEVRNYAQKMIGLKAPNFSVKNLKGEEIELDALKGQNVLLEVASTTCPACITSYPAVKKFKDMFGDQVKTLTVFPTETKQTVEEFFIKNNYVKDEEVIAGEGMNSIGNDYKIDYTPTFIFIDKEGYIQFIYVGGDVDDVLFSSMSDLAFKTNLSDRYNQIKEVNPTEK